jgi:hypothetical protein
MSRDNVNEGGNDREENEGVGALSGQKTGPCDAPGKGPEQTQPCPSHLVADRAVLVRLAGGAQGQLPTSPQRSRP